MLSITCEFNFLLFHNFIYDKVNQESESNVGEIGRIWKENNKFDKNTSNLSTTETDNNFLRSYLKSSFEFVNVFARFFEIRQADNYEGFWYDSFHPPKVGRKF